MQKQNFENVFEYINYITFEIIQQIRCINNEVDIQSYWLLDNEEKQGYIEIIKRVILDQEMTPYELHVEWVTCKIKQGWSYAGKTNRQEKKHNCLIDFDYLPFLQRLKDEIFLKTIIFFSCNNRCLKYNDDLYSINTLFEIGLSLIEIEKLEVVYE